MPRKQENFIKCVYLIGFKGLNKVYIGSTIRWPYREREHLFDLGANQHHNQYLQRAYNKHHKMHPIYVEVLGTFDCTEEQLRIYEEDWIAKYRSADKRYGYNMVPFPSQRGTSGHKYTPELCKRLSGIGKERLKDPAARERLSDSLEKAYREHPERFLESGFKIMTYTLYNPKGKQVTITNLHRFCRKHGLDYPCMREVAIDQRIEYMGWKKTPDRRHRRKNHYHLIGPDGKSHEGYSLRAFCLPRNLPYRSMCGMLRGEIKTCAGYRRADMDEKEAHTYRGKDHRLVSPTGETVTVNNMAAFCREHDLCSDALRKGYPSKGWRKVIS